MTLWLHHVLLDDQTVSIEIAGDKIHAIHDETVAPPAGTEIIHGNGTLRALPALFNGHTHAPMTLFRSFGDDLPLMRWLQEKIWPLENGITEDFVEWGMRLALLEMVKTGTTGFADMYWHFDACARIVEEWGLHGVLSGVFIDLFDAKRAKEQQAKNVELHAKASSLYPKYVKYAIGPHATYTVSEDSLKWASEFSASNNVQVHIHLSETRHEVDECIAKTGMTQVAYLRSLGLLSPRLICAHMIHLNDADRALVAEHGVVVVHNPTSNMKLAVGGPFNLKAMQDAGIKPVLGTDGAGSNNSLDLFGEMKIAALLQKHAWQDSEQGAAPVIWDMATADSWRQFGFDAGVIAPGKLAEIILVRGDDFSMVPDHDYLSNLVYSANGNVVDTTISSGRVLMKHGIVDGEAELIREFRQVAKRFVARAN